MSALGRFSILASVLTLSVVCGGGVQAQKKDCSKITDAKTRTACKIENRVKDTRPKDDLIIPAGKVSGPTK
jgi:hypothetical protein